MRCRAWETRHENGKKYIHVVDEGLEPEYIKGIAERLAGSPIEGQTILRDVVGSYLIADKGNESFGFSQFVELDSKILDDLEVVRNNLQDLIDAHKAEAQAILVVMERLGIKEDDH